MITIYDLDRELKPKTPNERAGLLALWTARPDLTEADVEGLKHSATWRTRTELYRGHDFCAQCDQIVPPEYCRECGLPMPRTLPSLIDLVPAPSRPRAALVTMADELFKTKLKPRDALLILHFYNREICKSHIGFEDVDSIFMECAAKAIERRRGVA